VAATVDLVRPLAEFAELLRSTLPSSVQFGSEYEAGVPAVMLDPTQIDQVLMNLCINARDAMNGRGSLRVGLRSRGVDAAVCTSCRKACSGDFVELAVTDSGQGIAPEVLERMFDPFFTTKQAGKGTGMGLSTTHGIVHDHGGHILVDTAPRRGATFRVLLPRAADSPAAGAVPRAGPAASAQGDALRGRLLLVDDDVHVLEYMEDQLREWGLEVQAFANPLDALHAVAEGEASFDIALLDQTMPGMNGIQLARALTGLLPDPRIILYTGYSDPIGEEERRDCCVIEVMQKPIDHAALHRLLRGQLGS
jgi:CheY-like chemotaxis protein